GAAAPLVLGKVATGLFVAPFDPANRTADDWAITLESKEGSGSSSATLRYVSARPTAKAPGPDFASLAEKLAIGLLGGAAAVLLLVGGRRRGGPVGGRDRRQAAGPTA